MAAAAFSLQQADERLFLTNVLGTYKGLGPDEAEDELREMFEQISEASDEEENATRVGGDLILDYVAKAKIDEKKVYLAGLQKKCWDGETPNRHKDRSDSEV